MRCAANYTALLGYCALLALAWATAPPTDNISEMGSSRSIFVANAAPSQLDHDGGQSGSSEGLELVDNENKKQQQCLSDECATDLWEEARGEKVTELPVPLSFPLAEIGDDDDIAASDRINDGDISDTGNDSFKGKGREDSRSSKTKTANTTGTKTNDISSFGEFRGAFQKLGTSWKNVFQSYIDVVRSAEGKSQNGDVYANNYDEGVTLLGKMVCQRAAAGDTIVEEGKCEGKQNSQHQQQHWSMWSFRNVPFQEFNRTLEDVFLAFLRWSAVDGTEDYMCGGGLRGGVNNRDAISSAEGRRKINVSKAFRRLESYAAWMAFAGGGSGEDDNNNDLLNPPLTSSSVRQAWDAFRMRLSRDECGRVVWWLDLGRADLGCIRQMPSRDTLRLFVWFSHLLMFDEGAQINGIVFVDSMGNVGFWHYMTMLPLQLGMKLDEFVISVVPLKTKLAVFLDRPLWMDVSYRMLSVFMTKKMKRRVIMVKGNDSQREIERIVGAADGIPVGFAGLGGRLSVDDFTDKYFSRLGR